MGDRFRVSKLLLQRVEEHGVRLPAVLRRAGLPATFLDAEKVFATTSELFALWRAVGETSDDPAIGLKLGAEPRLERYDPIAIAAVCSQSFRDAVERMARYKRLTCPEEIRLRTTRDEASVEFVFLEATDDEPDLLVDLCLSRILAIGRRGTDRLQGALRLELVRPSRHRGLLESHFGCRVKFGADRNTLVFRRQDLDLPFVTHNEDLLAAVRDRLESELEAQKTRSDVGDQVRSALRRSLAGRRPTVEQVAQDLGLSVRTLQRRLTDAGASFQQLVEDTRRELARHYLRRSGVELKEAAYLLGYEDANSFFRAFQGWEGTTPGAWRARHAASAAEA
jgi:AraC-like DNA-binding protein